MARSRQFSLPGMNDPEPEPAPAVPALSAVAASEPPPVKSAEPVVVDSPTALAGKTVYVIDANALIFQVFHAITEMTSPRGEPVNAVFGFLRDMLFLIEKKRPDFIFAAFDLAGPTFRHELHTEYKGTRSETPPDLSPQFAQIERVLAALRIPVATAESYEADDVLATIARLTYEAGGSCYIVSSDKDCRQLLNERVKVYNVRKDQIYDDAALAADWGVRPDQVVDFQSLVGDSVDNVQGVPLIGPKNAQELLKQYGTLEGIYEHLPTMKASKRRENLEQYRDRAMLNRRLVRLETEVPLTPDWNLAQIDTIDLPATLALCQEFGFHRFAEQLRSLRIVKNSPQSATVPTSTPATSDAATESPAAASTSTEAQPVAVNEAPWEANYQLVDTPEKFAAFLDELRAVREFSFDTETTDTSPTRAQLVGCSFCWREGEGHYIPVRGPLGAAVLDEQTVIDALRPLLEDSEIGKLGQNIKYDLLMMRGLGVQVRGVCFDSMMASYLLDAGERIHNLDELSARYLNHTTIKITELIGTGKSQKRMDDVPLDRITAYAVEDADVPWRLRPMLLEKLRAAQLESLFVDVELPLIDVLAELEANGIRVDEARLGELSKLFGERMAVIEQEIYALAGHEFNIASPKQLQKVLFDELGLPVVSRTKTGPSTDADVLEELASQHPLPAKIIEFRQYAKLKGTYVDALPLLVNPRTGRVHCSFHQAVAATGRLSSSDPNLQNIPIRTDSGREIRSAFLPAEGWELVAADYSQIELRVLAHFSEDATLCEAFARDDDIHALVASQVYSVPLAEVTKEQRRAAKAVNFGIIYGQSAFGLSKAIDVSQSEAQKFIDAYFARLPGVETFMNEVLRQCMADGYVKTILGRRRAITGLRPTSGKQRNLAERTAINTVIQGSAADLIKLAMLAVQRRLQAEGLQSRMLLQIHDELIFEAPPEEIATLRELLRTEMSSVMELRVPLRVDVKQGRNWAEVE